jgi:PKD repeat protein
MPAKNLFILFFFIFSGWQVYAQSCTVLGQTPATAFPVCGTNIFKQDTVPLCVNNNVTANGCGQYPDSNPFWYEFTCFKSGTLGFLITPNDLGDDYDWELFDITGHNPMDVYTDTTLFVVANWCGTYGKTGTSATATDVVECASFPGDMVTTYSKMPTLIQGHIYLLLVSHYTATQSGYQLTFSGGSAVITDPTIPSLLKAYVQCDAQTISIKTSKKMKCSSVAADGSDFSISDPTVSVTSATGFNCANSFDVDSIIIALNKPLQPGNYTISIKYGTDGNTLLDDCNNNITASDSVSFTVIPLAPTPLDSVMAVGCAPDILQLVFSKPIQCSTIAPDGSDFVLTGTSPATIVSANGICSGDNPQTYIIQLKLSSPIVTAGSYQVKLVIGDDGNSIIDICNLQTPAGSTVNFSTKDTVSALFNYQVLPGCKYDSIQFNDAGNNGINKWQWTFDSTYSSSLQNPLYVDTVFGQKYAQLIVTNGVCSDTSSVSILLDNTLKAAFAAQDTICPTDKLIFQNNSIGNIISWYWDFGDGTSSSDQSPMPHSYAPTNDETKYTVHLIAQNNLGCYDTATKIVTKLRTCYIAVPSAFTPNHDGVNDFLYPLNAFKAIT